MTYIDKLAALRPWSGEEDDEAETLNQLEVCWFEIIEVLREAEEIKQALDLDTTGDYWPSERFLGFNTFVDVLDKLQEKVKR